MIRRNLKSHKNHYLYKRVYDQYVITMIKDSDQLSSISGEPLAKKNQEFNLHKASVNNFIHNDYNLPMINGTSDNWAQDELTYDPDEMTIIHSHIEVTNFKVLPSTTKKG